MVVRIWDVPTTALCRVHLLGEHRELHAIWTIITTGKQGYANHPETKRWVGKLGALYNRHTQQVDEMQRRGYTHNSHLDKTLITGKVVQDEFLASIEEQRDILKRKNCECFR